MEDSHLTILGFMQPQAASGLIKDPTSIFVGFANRYLESVNDKFLNLISFDIKTNCLW